MLRMSFCYLNSFSFSCSSPGLGFIMIISLLWTLTIISSNQGDMFSFSIMWSDQIMQGRAFPLDICAHGSDECLLLPSSLSRDYYTFNKIALWLIKLFWFQVMELGLIWSHSDVAHLYTLCLPTACKLKQWICFFFFF